MPASVVSDRSAYQSARDELYVEEKKLSKLKDAITEQRRQLPWLRVSTPFTLIGAEGEVPFSALFGSHHQLVLYHMMSFKEGEYPCTCCSMHVEQMNTLLPSLLEHAAVAVVVRGPPDAVQALRQLRGWSIPLYACDSQFTHAVGTEGHPKTLRYGPDACRPGVSAYHRGLPDGSEKDTVFLTYDTFDRGTEETDAFFSWLDSLPVVTEREPAQLPWEKLYGPATTALSNVKAGKAGDKASSCCADERCKD